jgi:hypothetical protein
MTKITDADKAEAKREGISVQTAALRRRERETKEQVSQPQR